MSGVPMLRGAARVVGVGDGVAYGRCDPRGGWAARVAARHIAAEVANRFFNLSIPGSTLAGAAAQTPALLGPRRPDASARAAVPREAQQAW